MVKKTVAKQTTNATTSAPSENVTAVVVAAKKRAPRIVNKAETVTPPPVVVSEQVAVEAQTPSVRRVTTRDTVLEDFDNLINSINAELLHVRGTKEKHVRLKFLRSVSRQLAQLKTHSQKVMKKRRMTNPDKAHNSIFQLAVPISEELAAFNGWNPSEPRSRVDVTRALCKYIKDNSLQDQNDRRIILADAKLAKLLNYTPDKDTPPLNYSRLQSYMKVHFLPTNSTIVAPSVPLPLAARPSPSPKKSKTVAARK